MESTTQYTVNVYRLRKLCNLKATIHEIVELNKLIPNLTDEHERIAHRNLDDGIYNQCRSLIGERHPND